MEVNYEFAVTPVTAIIYRLMKQPPPPPTDTASSDYRKLRAALRTTLRLGRRQLELKRDAFGPQRVDALRSVLAAVAHLETLLAKEKTADPRSRWHSAAIEIAEVVNFEYEIKCGEPLTPASRRLVGMVTSLLAIAGEHHSDDAVAKALSSRRASADDFGKNMRETLSEKKSPDEFF